MHSIFHKTIGGLSRYYYFRQLFFSIVICGIAYFLVTANGDQIPIQSLIIMAINASLYPYSRFIYETAARFILGEKVVSFNVIFMLTAKLFTMLICWFFATVIAPIGLIYLYIHHSRQEKNEN